MWYEDACDDISELCCSDLTCHTHGDMAKHSGHMAKAHLAAGTLDVHTEDPEGRQLQPLSCTSAAALSHYFTWYKSSQ